MTPEEFAIAVGRMPSATDQMPGTYKFRAFKGAPWQAIRISFDGIWWHCICNGVVTRDSGRRDPADISLILWRGPFHRIPESEYMRILRDYDEAPPGSPLRTPNEPVNIRESKPL